MNNRKTILFCIVFLLGGGICQGQYDFPDAGSVFSDEEVARVDIDIDPGLLGFILDPINQESDTEYPATFYFTREGKVDTVENVGFRLRGNTSRASGKKSFKVSFNSFEQGRRYKGLDKLNLNGEHNDPSIMRSKTCWDLYQKVGIPSSRSNHVELYINNEYKGLYINVEHVDDRFLSRRFENDNGNLYKCLWPADLNYLGSDPELYKNDFGGRRAYDLKTNTEQDDYSDLANFIDVLNNTEGEAFKCEIEDVFDVDNYLKVIVMDILVSNWDGPIVNKNNFYLYNDPVKGRFTYIPFDLDNTFGIGWGGTQWQETDIYNWSDSWGNADRPLYEKIMSIDEYRNKVSYYFQTFIDEFFNNDFLNPYLDEFKEKLIPFRMNDNYASLDYGWDLEAFKKSFDQGLGAHVSLGLKQYIDQRTTSVEEQLEIKDPLTLFEYHNFVWGSEEIQFNIKVDFPWNVIGTIKLHYQIDEGLWEESTMTTDNNVDYTIMIENLANDKINYYFEGISYSGSRKWPYCDFYSIPANLEPAVHPVINEFLASNSASTSDEFGEYEDWIEIFNPGDTEINLANYYLSDNRSNPGKWQIKADLIPSEAYLNIWADEDGNQGDLHANFKLSKDGEYLGLYFKKEGIYFPIDTLTFPAQKTDISYGRLPNGTGDFQELPYPTFGYNNEGPSSLSEVENTAFASVWPNPASEHLRIKTLKTDKKLLSAKLMTLDGRTILVENNINNNYVNINLQSYRLTNSVYLLQTVSTDNQVMVNKILIINER